MPNTSISNLSAGAAVSATDLVPNVQTAGVGPVKTTAAELKTFMSASPTLVTPALGTPASGNFSTGTFTWPTFAVTNGGTGTSTQFTTGSVVFAGASGVYSQNVTAGKQLFWDNTNARLGVGTASPAYTVDVVGSFRAKGTLINYVTSGGVESNVQSIGTSASLSDYALQRISVSGASGGSITSLVYGNGIAITYSSMPGTYQVGTAVAAPLALIGNSVEGFRVSATGVPNTCSATATPAGGSTAAVLLFGTTAGFGIYYGSDAPTVSAAQGSLYLRSDGTAANRLYVNNNGSTGWTAY